MPASSRTTTVTFAARAALAGGLVVAVGVVVVALSGEPGAGDADELRLLPRSAPPSRPEPSSPQLETRDPLEVELLVVPRAALLPAAEELGRETLVVESRPENRRDAVELRVLAGLAAGRRASFSGRAVLTGLPRGWHWLEIRRGPRRCQRLVKLPRRAPVTIDWARSAVVAGRVFDEGGSPVEGAEVGVGVATARTAADGSFRLPGLVAGDDVPVRVAASGHAAYAERVRVWPGARPLRFVLGASYRVRGLVHVPAAERSTARLAVLPAGGRAGRFPFFWPGRYCDLPVDRSGRFVIDGLPRDVTVQIGLVHSTWALEEPVAIAPPRSRRHRSVEVHVIPRRQKVLRGSVLDETGVPVAGAHLYSTRSSRRRGAGWGESLAAGAGTALPGWVRHLGATLAVSRPDGSWELGLPWSRTRVRAVAPLLVGEERVFPRVSRQRWDVRLSPREGGSGGGAHVLALRLTGAGRRVLRVQVRWGGRVRESAFLHDPRELLEMPPLDRPGLLEVGVRVKGRTGEPPMSAVRVDGRTELTLALPGT